MSDAQLACLIFSAPFLTLAFLWSLPFLWAGLRVVLCR